jgi:hypothetical protein
MKFLFLDDERNPEQVLFAPSYANWNIVRSYDSAVEYIEDNGIPNFMSLDHDLGTEKTGYDFIKWLIYDYDNGTKFPENFDFIVHSMNIPGRMNMENLLTQYLEEVYDRELPEV